MNHRGEVSTPEYDGADQPVQAGGCLHRLGRRGMMPDRAAEPRAAPDRAGGKSPTVAHSPRPPGR